MTERKHKSLDPLQIAPELLDFRRRIDEMDDQIIDLIKRRSQIVMEVGEYKRKQGYKGCFIRAGREADMLRHIWQVFADSPFSPVAACAIWRIIIAASTNIESRMRISVYATEGDETLYWLAREYFGSFSTIIRHPNCNRVVGDVVDGKAEVGMLPAFTHTSQADWWLTLAQQQSNPPTLFAQVPFIASHSESQRHASFAIARIQAEPTDNDITLIAVETADISINRLTTAFAMAGMKASRIAFVNATEDSNIHHLLEVEGFIGPEDPRLQTIHDTLGDALVHGKVLGSYAQPILAPTPC